MPKILKNHWRSLLVDAQRRLPAGHSFVQEAFTSDHRHAVLIKLNELQPDTFYWFDEMATTALFQSVVEAATRNVGGRLTVGYTASDELRAHRHRLQHIASRLEELRVLAPGKPDKDIRQIARLESFNTTGTPLAAYRIALIEGSVRILFIAREQRLAAKSPARSLGFFSGDADIIEEITGDIDGLLRGGGRRLNAFERLEQLHQTTQQVARELESYSRRIQLAVARARRRPDLLTPARFERIVAQAVSKLEHLKDLPIRALRTMPKPPR